MNQAQHPFYKRRSRQGAILVLTVFLMVVFFVVAAFTVDVAYMQLVRTELRTATDAAARAGAGALSRGAKSDEAIDIVKQVAASNDVAGAPLKLDNADVTLGAAQFTVNGPANFFAGGIPQNAVQIHARRTNGSMSGAVPLYFGRLLGIQQFEPEQVAIAARLDRDVCLVLDQSGSMNSEGRWDALGEALAVFLAELNNTPQIEFVSLVTYSTSATKVQELTPNLDSVNKAFEKLSPGGWTAIGEGLLEGSDSLINDPLARSWAAKTIVIMTDGNHNTGESPEISVLTAKTRRQTVHTVTFSAGANQTLMSNVAALGGGIHLHAPDSAALKAAFQEIAATLPVVFTE